MVLLVAWAWLFLSFGGQRYEIFYIESTESTEFFYTNLTKSIYVQTLAEMI